MPLDEEYFKKDLRYRKKDKRKRTFELNGRYSKKSLRIKDLNISH
jgi:hypothetical protein